MVGYNGPHIGNTHFFTSSDNFYRMTLTLNFCIQHLDKLTLPVTAFASRGILCTIAQLSCTEKHSCGLVAESPIPWYEGLVG